MRDTIRHATILLLVIALAAVLTGCAAASDSGGLSSDESPVPEGMPVMYEFYTTT